MSRDTNDLGQSSSGGMNRESSSNFDFSQLVRIQFADCLACASVYECRDSFI